MKWKEKVIKWRERHVDKQSKRTCEIDELDLYLLPTVRLFYVIITKLPMLNDLLFVIFGILWNVWGLTLSCLKPLYHPLEEWNSSRVHFWWPQGVACLRSLRRIMQLISNLTLNKLFTHVVSLLPNMMIREAVPAVCRGALSEVKAAHATR